MRFATFNIWNNDKLFEERIDAICKALRKINADIVCLQEVRNEEERSITDIIAQEGKYPFLMFRTYPDCPDEGLAILSKFPFGNTSSIWEVDTDVSNYCAIRAKVNHGNYSIGITNVHLNWRSSETRKNQANAINSWISSHTDHGEYEVLCGDFNDIPQSLTHQFLLDCGWHDIVEESCETDSSCYATFDLVNNPYLKEDLRAKEKLRFDWILVNTFSNHVMTLETVGIFGNNKSVFKIIPSDHYGLFVDIR